MGDFYVAAMAVLCYIEFVHGRSPFLLPGSPPYIVLPENYPVGGELFVLHITDSDNGDSITLTPADPVTAIYVDIRASTGNNISAHVTLKKMLDREDKNRLTLTFIATDKTGNQITILKILYVADVNDNSPQFQNLPYTLDIQELPCKINAIVFANISAIDLDSGNNGTVGYWMEAVTQSETWKAEFMSTFAINSITGQVSLKKCLDYEMFHFYQFKVMAYDHGVPHLESYTYLTINVLDVDEQTNMLVAVKMNKR